MVATITASIELVVLNRPELRFIPQHEILVRAETTLRFPVPFNNAMTGKRETRDLIPDALFGLEYRRGSQRSYRFFLVEADRGTEPTRASRFNRKRPPAQPSAVSRICRQRSLQEAPQTHRWHARAQCRHPSKTMDACSDLLSTISPRGNSYQLFAHVDGFGQMFKPANAILNLTEIDGLGVDCRQSKLPDPAINRC